jgi:hypothetical protein
VGVVSAKGRLIANQIPNVVAAYLKISLIWFERQRIKRIGQFLNHLWDVQRKATTIGVPYTLANFIKMKEENQ